MNIKYERVIPRDFFNEAKLLKCMGMLSLKILDCQLPEGISIKIEESGEPFKIKLSEEGNLFVSNYEVFINDRPVMVSTTYNSKSNYPFHCMVDYCETPIFDESGEFTEEFIQTFNKTVFS